MCPQVLAPPKQKGAYPFFTFADLSMSDVIDDAAMGHVDISTLGSNSTQSSGHGNETRDPRSLDADYSDDDFLVVECRTNAAGGLTASFQTPSSPSQLEREEGAGDCGRSSQDSKTANFTANGSSATCSDNDESPKT